MNSYEKYSHCLVRSIYYVFKNFFYDDSIDEVFKTQSSKTEPKVYIEFTGTLFGEIVINFPVKTLNKLIIQIMPDVNPRSVKKHRAEVAGEIANLVTGTFANHLQYLNHEVKLSPPEYNNDPISMKTFFDNINLSFESMFGGFDVDLYYKEEVEEEDEDDDEEEGRRNIEIKGRR